MRILDQVKSSSILDLANMNSLFQGMILYGYCGFSSKSEAESADKDLIKKRLSYFFSSIGRFNYTSDYDGFHKEITCSTSPFLFPRYSNFEIVQSFIRYFISFLCLRKSCILGTTIITSASISNIAEIDKDRYEFSILQDFESSWALCSKWPLIESNITSHEQSDFVSCAALIMPTSTTSNIPISTTKDGVTFASALFDDCQVCILNIGSTSGCTTSGTCIIFEIFYMNSFSICVG